MSINRFEGDSATELDALQAILRERGVANCVSNFWARGGEGAVELAELVRESIANEACKDLQFVYGDEMSLKDKIEAVASRIYQAGSVSYSAEAEDELAELEELGCGELPICIAKTQYSFSADPKALGAPKGHDMPIRSARLSNGARFVVVLTGSIMTMPGLPRVPAAMNFEINENHEIEGF